MKNKTINIQNYDDFIDVGFKECNKCGWAFNPEFFDNHNCAQMNTPKDYNLPTENKKNEI